MKDINQTHGESVLVIDDDVELCAMLRDYLSRHGWHVTVAHSGSRGLTAAREIRPDLIVLDVMLPDIDGFETLRRIQRELPAHVLLLTARGEEVDRIVGLEMGADDYLPKPFNPRELLARMRAVVRRTTVSTSLGSNFGLSLNVQNREVVYAGAPLDLTDIEYMLMRNFLTHPGEILSREVLAKEALERPYHPFDRSLDMHVSRLRRKLELLTGFRGAIRTIRNNGYMLVSQTAGSPEHRSTVS